MSKLSKAIKKATPEVLRKMKVEEGSIAKAMNSNGLDEAESFLAKQAKEADEIASNEKFFRKPEADIPQQPLYTPESKLAVDPTPNFELVQPKQPTKLLAEPERFYDDFGQQRIPGIEPAGYTPIDLPNAKTPEVPFNNPEQLSFDFSNPPPKLPNNYGQPSFADKLMQGVKENPRTTAALVTGAGLYGANLLHKVRNPGDSFNMTAPSEIAKQTPVVPPQVEQKEDLTKKPEVVVNKKGSTVVDPTLKPGTIGARAAASEGKPVTTPEEDELKKLQDKYNQPVNLDFTGNKEDYKAQLENAQNMRNQSQLLAGLGNAGTSLLQSLIKDDRKLDRSTWDSIQKTSGQPIEEVDQRMKLEKTDPNSSQSIAARQLLDRAGIKYEGTPSAADLESVLPKLIEMRKLDSDQLFKAEDRVRTINAAKDAATLKREELANNLKIANMSAKEKENTRLDEKYKRDQTIADKYKEGMISKLRNEVSDKKVTAKLIENYSNTSSVIENLEYIMANPNAPDKEQRTERITATLGAMKALQQDPSVVRESDLAQFLNSLSVFEKIYTEGSSFFGQQKFPESVKQRMMNSLKDLQASTKNGYMKLTEPQRNTSKRLGLDQSEIFHPAFIENEGKSDSTSKSNNKRKESPGEIVIKNGKSYRVLEDGYSVEEVK